MKNIILPVKGVKPALLLFLLPVGLALILSSCERANKDNNSANDTHITLFVKTDSIDSAPIDSLIRINDSGGSSSRGRVKKHISEISSGKMVFWKVKPEPGSRRKVETTKITNKQNGSFKLIDSLEFVPSGSLVKARVKNKYNGSEEDSYNIHFVVVNKDGDSVEFTIDPILRMVR